MIELELRIRIIKSLTEVPPAAWDACAGSDPSLAIDEDNFSDELLTRGKVSNPFVSHDFLSSLEQSLSVGRRTGWEPRHLLAEDAERICLFRWR